MALAVLTTGAMEPAPPETLEAPPSDHDHLRAYFSQSSTELVATLRSIDPEFRCWTFLGEPHNAAFWIRRQAHEHAIHRFDAEAALAPAAGASEAIDADVAVDGVDEYFVLQNLRTLPKKPDFELTGSLHLHATDDGVHGEWMITYRDRQLNVTPEHGKGDAAIRGTASDLLLGLWGRRDLVRGVEFERFGSGEVIEALSSLGGT
jgi:Mycothiol maleylpyruvate isomerase N-terminal domain/MDMPI C-terminal domain